MTKLFIDSIKKTFKGGSFLFFSLIASFILLFLINLILARYLSPDDFGMYTLSINIIKTSIVISFLGLVHGASSLISFYRQEKNLKRVMGVIKSSLIIVSISSLSVLLLGFFISPFLSQIFLKGNFISNPLKVAFFAVPFTSISIVMASIFLGFEKAKPRALVNLFIPFLRLIMFLAVIFVGLSLMGIIFAYVFASVIVFLLMSTYFFKKIKEYTGRVKSPVGFDKGVISFSLPLFGHTIFNNLFILSGSYIIAYFRPVADIAVYNVAHHLSVTLTLLSKASIFIFIPVISGLYAKKHLGEIRSIYLLINKWIFILSLPVLILFFFYPQFAVIPLFGNFYLKSAPLLKILMIGMGIHLLFAMNSSTMISLRKTKLNFIVMILMFFVNFLLGLWLVPMMGMLGMVIAISFSYLMLNLIYSSYLYMKFNVPFFDKSIIKVLAVVFILIFPFDFFVGLFIKSVNFFSLITLLAIISLIVFFSVFIVKPFNKEDKLLLSLIKKKIKKTPDFDETEEL